MKSNPQNIDALFNSQARYVVPMFQRLYVWQENPQWSTLWDDIVEKAALQIEGKISTPHYLGALIIEGVRPSSAREVKRLLVIDGQQRLTTIQLLLCAFRDFARLKNWQTLDRTTSRYLENADIDVMESPSEERFKLWPTTLNRTFFAAIVLAGSSKDVAKKFPLTYLKYKRKPELRSALVEAYLYFYGKIEAWVTASAASYDKSEESCAFAFLQSLQQDFCVVEIVLSEGDDSQEIFYSLNSQGRPLSQSDLLRSLIFMRAEKQKQDRDSLFQDYWGQFETEFWSAETRRAGRTYSRLDLGLRYFLMAKTGLLVDTRRVNEEYRRWITAEPPRYPSIREELRDFAAHCNIFERFETIPPGLSSVDLRRVLRDFDVSTSMPLILFLERNAGLSPDQLSECLHLLESFIARRVFMSEETKEYNKLFVELVSVLQKSKGADVVQKLRKALLAGGGSTRHWPTDSEVVETAISRPASGRLRIPALRLILERIELWTRQKKSEERAIADGLQIEHILPQSWSEHWPLSGKVIPQQLVSYPHQAKDEFEPLIESIRARNEKLHTIGNLTLLNQYLNPAVGKASFDTKKAEYSNSVLQLNRYFDKLKSWDEDTIKNRGRAMGEAICKIWPIPEG